MKSLADLQPPEIAAQLHPDLLKNEAAYWAVRDQLLEQYQGQWIGFADGIVAASGKSAVAVLHEAQKSGRHPHVTFVGHEYEPDRIRRTSFPYDTSRKEPMPLLDVEFRTTSGVPGSLLDHVIPDTGGDASTLPWADCCACNLIRHLASSACSEDLEVATRARSSSTSWSTSMPTNTNADCTLIFPEANAYLDEMS